MKHEESRIQEAVVTYLRHQYPTALHCASAGGVRTSMKQAIMMKRTGYVRGFPDLMILESSKDYKGLFIEMKTEKGVASKEQKWWKEELTKRGYRSEICKGFDSAKQIIDEYFK
jgi:hypothetical protein